MWQEEKRVKYHQKKCKTARSSRVRKVGSERDLHVKQARPWELKSILTVVG